MTTILVSHDDLDGVAANVIATAALGMIEIHNVGYNDIDRLLMEISRREDVMDLYIVDIAPKKLETIQALDAMAIKGRTVLLFDHHEAHDAFGEMDWAQYEEESGTQQFFKYFAVRGYYEVGKYATFAALVNDYDCGIKKDYDSDRLNHLFFILGREGFVKRCLETPCPHKFSDVESLLISNYVASMERYINDKLSQMLVRQIHDAKVGVMFAEQFQTEIGYAARKAAIDVDCVLMLDVGRRKASLRSVREGFSVGQYARGFHDGGGRAATAGFQLTEREIDAILNSF